jgi:hypothetical protein
MTTITGEQAQSDHFVMASVRFYLRIVAVGMKVRGMTMGKLLARASDFTGKKYTATKESCRVAIDDLTALLESV